MYRYIIPYRVTKGQESIILFAVWTKKIPYDYDKNVIKAVSCDEYAPLLSAKAVVIGDYNSGANKFHKDRYSALASKMNKSGLFNAVNDAGKESCFTFYGKYHENEDKNWFTNDFCFVTKDLLPECRVEILNEWDNNNMWQGLSDHCPIRVEIGFAK
jgi:endonuclease/exonuclease/phosphatase family metal-dependent hydrolase